MDTDVACPAIGDPAMPFGPIFGAAPVSARPAEDGIRQGRALSTPNTKPTGGAVQHSAVVAVQPDGEAGFAGRAPGNGRVLSADNAEADGGAGLAAAFGSLPVALRRERLAIGTAAAPWSGRHAATFDAGRAVGPAPLLLGTGAMGLATRGKAVLAAGLAVCGGAQAASKAKAGLSPLVAQPLLAGAVGFPIVLTTGGTAAGAGGRNGGAAVPAKSAIVHKKPALPFRLAGAGAAALDAVEAATRAVCGPDGMAAAACGFGGRRRVGRGGSRHAGHGSDLLLAGTGAGAGRPTARGTCPDNPFPTFSGGHDKYRYSPGTADGSVGSPAGRGAQMGDRVVGDQGENREAGNRPAIVRLFPDALNGVAGRVGERWCGGAESPERADGDCRPGHGEAVGGGDSPGTCDGWQPQRVSAPLAHFGILRRLDAAPGHAVCMSRDLPFRTRSAGVSPTATLPRGQCGGPRDGPAAHPAAGLAGQQRRERGRGAFAVGKAACPFNICAAKRIVNQVR